jgi:hypothetical protein
VFTPRLVARIKGYYAHARNSLPSPLHCTTPFFSLFPVHINIKNIYTTTQDSTGTTSLFPPFRSYVYHTYKKRQALHGRQRVHSCSARAPASLFPARKSCGQFNFPTSWGVDLQPKPFRTYWELNADLSTHLNRLEKACVPLHRLAVSSSGSI